MREEAVGNLEECLERITSSASSLEQLDKLIQDPDRVQNLDFCRSTLSEAEGKMDKIEMIVIKEKEAISNLEDKVITLKRAGQALLRMATLTVSNPPRDVLKDTNRENALIALSLELSSMLQRI